MFNWLKPQLVDWSEIERLEQRIRDIRGRIWKAKNPQRPIFPSSRMDATEEIEKIRFKSFELRRSLGKGPTISAESTFTAAEAAEIEAKLAGTDLMRAKLKKSIKPQ